MATDAYKINKDKQKSFRSKLKILQKDMKLNPEASGAQFINSDQVKNSDKPIDPDDMKPEEEKFKDPEPDFKNNSDPEPDQDPNTIRDPQPDPETVSFNFDNRKVAGTCITILDNIVAHVCAYAISRNGNVERYKLKKSQKEECIDSLEDCLGTMEYSVNSKMAIRFMAILSIIMIFSAQIGIALMDKKFKQAEEVKS